MYRCFLLGLTGCFVTNADLSSRLDNDGDGFFALGDLGDDCDDTDPAIHPEATEIPYNGIDEDCDGPDDDGDADGDGFQRENDCNDADPEVRPDAVEVYYDGLDQNCDGADDYDQDGDGTYPDGSGPPGLSLTPENTDCDDMDPTVFGVEVTCDGVDNDCTPDTPDAEDADGDGVPSCDDCDDHDDTVNLVHRLYYLDADGDGFGNPDTALESCRVPVGYIRDDQDCDDLVFAVNPAATELCNGVDDDCSGHADDDPLLPTSAYYPDVDGDGFGNGDEPAEESCLPIVGKSTLPTDCDDEDPSASPVGLEFCGDGIDSDCDGSIDDADALGLEPYHLDGDGDGAGDPGSDAVLLCSIEDTTGFATNELDCDPHRPDRWRGPFDDAHQAHDLGDAPTPTEISRAFSETCEGALLEFGGTVDLFSGSDGVGFPLRLGGSDPQAHRPGVTLRGRSGATVHSDFSGVMLILEEGCVGCTVEQIAFRTTAPETAFARIEVEDAGEPVTFRGVEVQGFDSRFPGIWAGGGTGLHLDGIEMHGLTLSDALVPGDPVLEPGAGVVVVGSHSGAAKRVEISSSTFRDISTTFGVEGAVVVNRASSPHTPSRTTPSELIVTDTRFAAAASKGILMEDATGKLEEHDPALSLQVQNSLFHDLADYAIEVIDPDGAASGENTISITGSTISAAPGLVTDLASPGMTISDVVMHVGPLGPGDPPADFFQGVPLENLSNCVQSVLPTSATTPPAGTLDPSTGCVESGGPEVLFVDPTPGADGIPLDLNILNVPAGSSLPLGFVSP